MSARRRRLDPIADVKACDARMAELRRAMHETANERRAALRDARRTMTPSEIADALGVSRQAITKALSSST